jgi:rhomboid protease GluP
MEEASCILEANPLNQNTNSITTRRVRRNWLTKRLNPNSFFVAAFSVLLLVGATFLFWDNNFNSGAWMTAIPQNVFNLHEYWRPWTALFAHADLEHLLSNSILFFAFAAILYGHFGSWVFPIAAFFFGGITNFIVLTTLPIDASLLGASCVVYWMGAVWLTLYLYLESRENYFRRGIKAVGVGIVLFIPETFRPHVSYLSHFVGFLLGVLWALGYYHWNRQRFLEAEFTQLEISEETSFND